MSRSSVSRLSKLSLLLITLNLSERTVDGSVVGGSAFLHIFA